MKQDPVDILWQEARAAPTPQPDLQRTWHRLDAEPTRSRPWTLAGAIAIGVAMAFVAAQARLTEQAAPAPTRVSKQAPRFAATRLVLPTPREVPPAPLTRSAPLAHAARATATPRPPVVGATVPAPQLSTEPVTPPLRVTPAAAAIAAVAEAPGPTPSTAYQPRAIVEFRRIDWARWQAQALPAAVAQMVQLRDSKGLLALLDTMPLKKQQSPLLMLRGQLRAQARRCEDAQADMRALTDAGPSDLQKLCRP